jgi:hypothetical protein
MGQIEEFYRDGKISHFEYIYLKNQVDRARILRIDSASYPYLDSAELAADSDNTSSENSNE